jgi:hypothetical protein
MRLNVALRTPKRGLVRSSGRGIQKTSDTLRLASRCDTDLRVAIAERAS